jgi:hypothetical protein
MKKLKIYKDIEEYFKHWFKSKIYNGDGVVKDSVFQILRDKTLLT